MALHRLFEGLEIDWQQFRGPALDRDAAGAAGGPGQGGPPLTLENFRSEHLRSPVALEGLRRQAVARGLLADSEADRIHFLATAAYCLRVGRRPAALFAHLVRRREFPASHADEERGWFAFKRHLAEERRRGTPLRYVDRRAGTRNHGKS